MPCQPRGGLYNLATPTRSLTAMPKIKKIINNPHDCAAELLDGLVEAYDGECQKAGRGCIVRTNIPDGKVALLIGGGSGHEPIYHGLVGHHLADGAACGDIFAAPPPDVVLDGMKSFASGHSSTSFAAATFTSLWIGSELVWNDDRPSWGPAVGALAIGTLYTAAGAVAASRIDDNRHHPEDVVAGAALGATLGATAFLVHFDIDGKARHRSWNVVPTTSMGATGTGNGLALVGSF